MQALRPVLLLIAILFGIALQMNAAHARNIQTAIFAGGCFWCVEADFDKVPGVLSTTSGYIGGKTVDPTYKQVSAGGTGHAEAVRILYDPTKLSYKRLLDIFFRSTDPLTAGRQFCDIGDQYRNAIFYLNERQRKAAEQARANLQASGRLKGRIVTTIEKAIRFYPAEGYHQNFARKNAVKYKFYRWNCGRDQRIKQIWGKNAYTF
ncbi:MAG: peptide-methionine (S)-S-oxide reductase MsrA [Hyphomicrobiales bacterium]|nr:peptide-methionine (S)-S-oxide reductase MsrA [Hyphomicrobiales bacterium]